MPDTASAPAASASGPGTRERCRLRLAEPGEYTPPAVAPAPHHLCRAVRERHRIGEGGGKDGTLGREPASPRPRARARRASPATSLSRSAARSGASPPSATPPSRRWSAKRSTTPSPSTVCRSAWNATDAHEPTLATARAVERRFPGSRYQSLMARANLAPILSAASSMSLSERCAYRNVICTLAWPRIRETTGTGTPFITAWLATVCRLCLARDRRHYIDHMTMS